ncbi:MAG: hypothetical protein QOF20_3039 [Acidimicrobiaceae bacterium]|jgi:hypothetical protein|nr:hypothetical protein [Acidimicrobiaceae bacterium]
MLRWYDAAPVPQTLSATGARSKPRPSVFDLQGADTTRRNAALACADRPVESASKIRSNSVMRSAPPVVSHADAGLPGQRDRFRGFATVSCDGRRSNEIQRSLRTERLISVAMATAPPRLMRHIEVLGDSLPRAERYAEPGREVPE